MDPPALGRRARSIEQTGLFAAAGVTAAVVVGLALTLIGGFEYHVVAVIGLPSGITSERLSVFRAELLAHAWSSLSTSGSDGRVPAWRVDSPGAAKLSLTIREADRNAGVSRLRGIADGFVGKMRAILATQRDAPSDAERVVAEYVDDLQRRLSEFESQVASAVANLPGDDPTNDRDQLLFRWRALRGEFGSAREELAGAAERTAQLAAQPPPTRAVIPTETRRAALEADAALQQDLKELNVSLSETRVQLLAVWQDSAAKLDLLKSAAENLAAAAARDVPSGTSDAVRQLASGISKEATSYLTAVRNFDEAWTREFTYLQHTTIDPMSADTLELHQRARTVLQDFLFAGDQRLTQVRSLLNPKDGLDLSDVGSQAMLSSLTRCGHAAQQAHHQFEFATAGLDSRDNFRLDSALNRARGLRRRTQDRIRSIEQRLEKEAVEQARKDHAAALASARERLAEVRQNADRAVDELVALQEGLNVNAGLSEQFLRAMLQVEVARTAAAGTRENLERSEARLRQLAAEREATPAAEQVEVLSVGVVGPPVNLGERLRIGAVGAALTLASAFGLHFLVRQRWSR